MKKCSRCGLVKDKSEFYKRTMKTMISVSSYCKSCSKEHKTQWIKKNRDKVRVNRIWSRYRMRPDDINKILESQGYLCAICGENEPVVIDHDHSCCPEGISCGKCVRGLLCQRCNVLVGQLEVNKEIINKALLYIEDSIG